MLALGRPLNQPIGRASSHRANAVDRQTHMLAFFDLGHIVVIDPAPPVANDLVAFSEKGGHRLRTLLHSSHYPEYAHPHVELLENPQKAPNTDAGSILEDAFDDRTAHAVIGRKANVAQHVLGLVVAFQERSLASRFKVEIEVDRNARVAGPARVRRVRSIA